jgi:hypothetical protein
MSDKTFKVPPEVWAAFVDAQTAASDARNKARDSFEAMAVSVGVMPPTMVVLEDGVVSGEPPPDPALQEMKQILTMVSVLQSNMSEEARAKVLELLPLTPVRKLGDQVDKLYDGWTLDAAYSEPDEENALPSGETFQGKIMEVLGGSDDS